MPGRPAAVQAGPSASSPTLNVCRSARSRSFVSSFLPEIVSDPVGDDRVAEPVGARGADDVRAPLARPSTSQRDRPLAGLRRRSSAALRTTSRSVTRPACSTRFSTATVSVLAGRLPLGVERRGLERERLAVEVDVARRRQVDPEAADAEHDVGRRGDVVLRQLRRPAAAPAPRRTPRSANSTWYLPAASVVPWRVRPSGSCTAIGRPGQRRAVLVAGDDVALDRLAPVVDRLAAGRRPGRSSRAGTPGPRTRPRSRSCPAGRAGRGTCPPAPRRRAGGARGTCRSPRA